MSDFGKRLRRLRKDKDITQAQLAEYLGVVSSAVGKYETIDDAYPTVESLMKIAEYFNVSVDFLLFGDTSNSRYSGNNQLNCSLSNSSLIQANQGSVINAEMGVRTLSPEAVELLSIYEALDGRGRLKLLNFAVELEDDSQK